MDVPKNEDKKESIITLQDFPFICRICCSKRSDLRLFEDENYLLDLFHAIRKIDVPSFDDYPRNICSGCISKLKHISMFIDVSKYNDASFQKNMETKEEIIEYEDEFESKMPRELIEKNEENEEVMSISESQICRICLSPASILIDLAEKVHLMQLFQDITNIDVSSAMANSVCNKCDNQLQKISSFLSSSLYNDQTLENAIFTNKAVKTESHSNPIEMELSKVQELTHESSVVGNEAVNTNTSEESPHFRENMCKIEIIDIKEAIIDSELATSTELRNEGEIHPQVFSKEKPFDKNQQKLTHKGENPFDEKEQNQRTLTNTGEKPIECDWCEKTFTQTCSLKRHMLTHTGEKPFECDSCEKKFTRKVHLKQHMLTHTGEKPFSCNCCDTNFADKSNLRMHLLTHTGSKRFECSRCDRKFTQGIHLKQHILTHTGEKPFVCDRCEKGFTQVSSLKRHILTHTRGKPFKCDCCEEKFAGRVHLKRHMLAHTGEKPFVCGFCKKGFIQASSFKRHMVIHAGEKLFECN